MPPGPFPILFIAPPELEDAIFVTGLFKRLHDEIDNASFTVVTGPKAAELFREAPKREATLIDEGPGLGRSLDLWGRLRGRRWGLILDAAGRKLFARQLQQVLTEEELSSYLKGVRKRYDVSVKSENLEKK